MFKNVYHDPQKNKIHLWESKHGKTVYSCLDHKAAYYVKDPTDTSDITDIYGTRVIKKFAESKKALSQIRKAVKTYESDISEEVKFLHARYGDSEERVPSSDYNTVALDIEIEVVGEFPKPELAKYPINLITINFINRGKVWTIGNRPYTGNSELVKNYECVEDEKQLLTRFIEVWRRSKIDIVTGWNVDTFDLQYIINRCKNLNVDCSDLSPVGKAEVKKNGKCFIAGITILDYIDLYKKFSFTPQPSYKLEYICQYELKKGKKHYDGSIFDIYKTDWNLFVEYNIVDTILIGDLEGKRKFIDLAINLCTESRTPLEKVVSSIWVIEGYILRYLHRYNKIMPDRQSLEESEYEESDDDEELLGGYVEAHPGFYKYLLSFDVESLYPHMIMMFNISPETKIKNPESFDDLIKTPIDGVYYSKKIGILPEIVETIFKERKAFKTKMFEAEKDGNEELTEYYDSMQMVRKILINSVYGVLSNKFFHFFDNDNASVITAGGRELIQFMAHSANSYVKDYLPKTISKTYSGISVDSNSIPKTSVAVIDTDSCYLSVEPYFLEYRKMGGSMSFMDFANDMDSKILTPFFNRLIGMYCTKFNIENKINFKREKIILKMFVQAKKKYITQIIANEKTIYDTPEIKITGLETRKSDLPKFCKDGLLEMFDSMFTEDCPNEDKMLAIVRKYQKIHKQAPIEDIAIPKGVKDYKKYSIDFSEGMRYLPSTPIHNRASINHNYMVQKYKLPFREIDDGAKIKYVFLKENNEIHQNVIAFDDQWPEKFNSLFAIDRNTLFEKSFMEIAQRIFDVLGFRTISLKESKLGNFIKRTE